MILPHCFLENLVETFISGSKRVTAINGKNLPSANDTTYKKWFNENGKEKIYVDNIRKYIVKNCRVHNERNSSPNLITAVIIIELQ